MFKDYYDILQITRQAGGRDIKQAYRRLALKYHPDRNPDNKAAEEKFKIILDAYRTLSNPEVRRRYDLEYGQHIQPGFQFRPAGKPAEQSTDSYFTRKHTRTANTSGATYYDSDDSITRQFSEYMSRTADGREAAQVERVTVKCPDCNGRGLRHLIFSCPRCGGEGYYAEIRDSSYQVCPACRGNGFGELFFLGTSLCDYCDGLGVVQPKINDEACPHCHGYGWTLADSFWRRMFLPYRVFIARKEECYWCNGTGLAPYTPEADKSKQCPDCHGRGWIGRDMSHKKHTCSRCKGSGSNTYTP